MIANKINGVETFGLLVRELGLTGVNETTIHHSLNPNDTLTTGSQLITDHISPEVLAATLCNYRGSTMLWVTAPAAVFSHQRDDFPPVIVTVRAVTGTAFFLVEDALWFIVRDLAKYKFVADEVVRERHKTFVNDVIAICLTDMPMVQAAKFRLMLAYILEEREWYPDGAALQFTRLDRRPHMSDSRFSKTSLKTGDTLFICEDRQSGACWYYRD